ncbi:MAG: hypothetical protein ACLRRK_01335 [Parasutterella sp.]
MGKFPEEIVMLRRLRKTAGSPESGLPASNINAADGYENQLSATAEMINTSSARGTAAFTLKVNPSLFSCVKISTEISEVFEGFIASSPSCDFGSTVCGSWAVAVLRGQNEHPYRLSFLFGNPRREFVTGNVSASQTESQKSLGFEREAYTSSQFRAGNFTRMREELYAPEKMPEQNNRPGIARRYRLIKSNSAPAPITARETEPSKLTTKSALKDNSLNTIRSRNSRTCLRFTTNLLVQGLGACPRRIEPCVFLPLRKLEDFISKGASASLSESILYRKTKALNPTRFSFSKEEESCA